MEAIGLSAASFGVIHDPVLCNKLNSILNTQGPVYIMTVTREPNTQHDRTSWKTKIKSEVLVKICQALQAEYDRNTDPQQGERLHVVVFDEYFCGLETPLNEQELSLVKFALIGLSHYNSKMILYMNFLYSGKATEELVNAKRIAFQQERNYSVYDPMAVDPRIPAFPNHPTEFIRNETIGIQGSNERTFYKKSSYYKECNLMIDSKFFDFGDGEDHVYKKNDRVAKAMVDVFSTEICLDLNFGKRKLNNWRSKDQPSWFPNTSVHILQSKHISAIDNYGNLPSKWIVQADPFVLGQSNTFRIENDRSLKHAEIDNEFYLTDNTCGTIRFRVFRVEC